MQTSNRIVVGVLAVAFASAACRRHDTERAGSDAAPAIDRRAELRESSRELVTRECGECHDGGRDPLPAALRIFDVTEIEWARRMTEAQLHDAARRLGDDITPTRGSGDPRPLHVSPDELRDFRAYVDAELAERRAK